MKLRKIIAFVLISSLLMPGVAMAETENRNDIVYCETTVITQDELTAPTTTDKKLMQNIMKVQEESPDLNLVKVVQKEVYLSETYDKDGTVLDSHFMTQKEVENFQKNPQSRTILGDQTEVAGKLTFTATLYDDASNNYYAYATADWENGSWIITDGYDFPAAGKDHIVIAWGGNFKRANYQSSGTYQVDGDDIIITTGVNDASRGICWCFDERKTVGYNNYFADEIQTSVKITPKTATNNGRTANIQFIYYHTYENKDLNVSFEVENGFVSTNHSGVTGVRVIPIDFPELQY